MHDKQEPHLITASFQKRWFSSCDFPTAIGILFSARCKSLVKSEAKQTEEYEH